MMPRARFKKDIVCEFTPPAGAMRRSQKIIILASGMPGAPKAKEVMEFWSKRGFWVLLPRYRGTWESGGRFLKRPPHEDILDVIDELPKGFTDLWSGKRYRLPSLDRLYVFGGSFGGPAAIFCSRDPRVTKAVAFASVIDWTAASRNEPLNKLGRYLPKAFGTAYRFSMKDWRRLERGELYNPLSETDSFYGRKLLLIHAKNDDTAPYSRAKRFAKRVGAGLVTLRTGGHFGFQKSLEPRLYERIKKFLRQRA